MICPKSFLEAFWTNAVRRRWVLGFLGGPPCEAWRRAREHALEEDSAHSGPRVIRSAQEPWGFQSLRIREIKQILVGNQLMLFALSILVELYLTGGCGLLEHPAMPANESSASIWRTPILQLLLSLEDFVLHELAQGLLGAASAKPTMLLTLRLPDIVQQICRWRLSKDLPKGTSLGRGTDGNFKTMFLKEFPPAFCGAIASSFFSTVVRMPTDATIQPEDDFVQTCATMHVQEYGEALGPDFAGCV